MKFIKDENSGTATLRRDHNGTSIMSNKHILPNPSQIAAADMQQAVKRTMTALTRLLVGRQGDPHGQAFNQQMMVIVGGPLPPTGLLGLADMARGNRKHVIHLSFVPDSAVPTIALAHRCGDRVEVYENCMLCLGSKEDRVRIVPDSFQAGAFQFTPAMKLKRGKAPRHFEAAMTVMARAYNRFYDLHTEAITDERMPIRCMG